MIALLAGLSPSLSRPKVSERYPQHSHPATSPFTDRGERVVGCQVVTNVVRRGASRQDPCRPLSGPLFSARLEARPGPA